MPRPRWAEPPATFFFFSFWCLHVCFLFRRKRNFSPTWLKLTRIGNVWILMSLVSRTDPYRFPFGRPSLSLFLHHLGFFPSSPGLISIFWSRHIPHSFGSDLQRHGSLEPVSEPAHRVITLFYFHRSFQMVLCAQKPTRSCRGLIVSVLLLEKEKPLCGTFLVFPYWQRCKRRFIRGGKADYFFVVFLFGAEAVWGSPKLQEVLMICASALQCFSTHGASVHRHLSIPRFPFESVGVPLLLSSI